MRRAELPLVIAILAAALLVRVVSLSCDPPGWLSWSAGIYSDEGIYSEDARLWTLYGQHMQGDFHASVIAPLQNFLLLAVFRHVAVSLRSVRLVSVAFAMATLFAYWLALRLWYGRTIALAGLALLSFSAPFVFYNRLGLLETPALFWLVLSYLMLGLAERSPTAAARTAALGLAGLMAAIAVVWKGTFALGALPLLIFAIWRHRLAGLNTIAAFASLIAAYIVAWYLPHQVELAGAGRYYVEHQYLPHSAIGLWRDIRRGAATGDDDGVLPYLLRYAAPCFTIILCAIGGYRREDAALWLWLGIPVAAMLFSNYTPSRYFLIFWPPMIALMARSFQQVPKVRAERSLPLLLSATLMVNFAILAISWRNRTYTLHDGARTLAQVLPRDAWVAGQFAPSLCLDNSLRSMYVQKGLANDGAGALELLPITHVLATKVVSPASDPWTGKYGELIGSPGGLRSLPVGTKFTVDLYANKEALP